MSGWNAESMDQMIAESEEGPLHAMDAQERDFERLSVQAGDEGTDVPEAPVSAVQAAAPQAGGDYPDLSGLTVRKVSHRNLVLDGVCSHCGHCGHELTDAQSIQRGIGPICSKRGYSEEEVDGDEMQAMVDLAAYPELVEFLTEHYRPLGIRGLVNGLVRVASLNRPHGRGQKLGNSDVFAACCDAIESLGHKRMASLLRETLAALDVRESKAHPGCWEVWVLSRDWTPAWSGDLKKEVHGSHYCPKRKRNIVPVHRPDDPGQIAFTVRPGGARVTNKRALWDLMQRHFPGRVAKVCGKAVKIREAQ